MERSFDYVGLHALAERSLPPLPLQSGLPFDRGHGGSQLLKLCDGPVRLIAWSIGNCQFISSQTAIWQSTPLVFPFVSNSSASDLVASDFKPGRKDRFRDAHSRTVVGFVDISECSAARDLYASTVSPSVTVCQPQDLIYSNSPAHWIADSRDTSHSVTAMQVYVDNKLVTNSPSASLNEELSFGQKGRT